MFFGEFEYKVDELDRVEIPLHFRKELRDGLILTRGIEKCIAAYPLSEWKRLAATSTNGLATPSKPRRLARAIFGSAFSLNIDKQGRIALPVSLRQYARIEHEAIVLGVNNHVELWDKIHWEEEKAMSQEQVWQIIESLEHKRGTKHE